MRLSIVVPNYNHGRFLEGCLESIRTQTYKDYEVFIYDNKSLDNSVEIAEKYTSTDPRFHLLAAPVNTGCAVHGINIALRLHATGQIGMWVNSDDELQDDALGLLMPFFDDPTIGFVRTALTLVWEDNDRIEIGLSPPWEPFSDILESNKVFIGSPFLRDLFLEVGGLDDMARFFDWDFWVRYAIMCKKKGLWYKDICRPTVIHRMHGFTVDPKMEEKFDAIGQSTGNSRLTWEAGGRAYIQKKNKHLFEGL